MKIGMKDWKWFGHAAHLCVGHDCRFHLATQVGPWLVSTVGEYWGSRSVREIHASAYDPEWFAKNSRRKGDDFDRAYMDRFGFEEIGCDRKYETMVFRAVEPCASPKCGCGLPQISGSDEDFDGYNDAKAATEGHMAMCKKWASLEKEGN